MVVHEMEIMNKYGVIIICLLVCLAGCATITRRVFSFPDAVARSLTENETVIIDIPKGNRIYVSGRLTTYEELSELHSLPGISNSTLIEITGEPGTCHGAVRKVLSILMEQDFKNIQFRKPEK